MDIPPTGRLAWSPSTCAILHSIPCIISCRLSLERPKDKSSFLSFIICSFIVLSVIIAFSGKQLVQWQRYRRWEDWKAKFWHKSEEFRGFVRSLWAHHNFQHWEAGTATVYQMFGPRCVGSGCGDGGSSKRNERYKRLSCRAFLFMHYLPISWFGHSRRLCSAHSFWVCWQLQRFLQPAIHCLLVAMSFTLSDHNAAAFSSNADSPLSFNPFGEPSSNNTRATGRQLSGGSLLQLDPSSDYLYHTLLPTSDLSTLHHLNPPPFF